MKVCLKFREYKKVCQKLKKYGKVSQNLRKYEELCKKLGKYGKVSQKLRKYSKVSQKLRKHVVYGLTQIENLMLFKWWTLCRRILSWNKTTMRERAVPYNSVSQPFGLKVVVKDEFFKSLSRSKRLIWLMSQQYLKLSTIYQYTQLNTCSYYSFNYISILFLLTNFNNLYYFSWIL